MASAPHTLNIQDTHKMCKMPKESTLTFGKTVTVLLEHLAIDLLSFTYSNAKFACTMLKFCVHTITTPL